MKQLSQKQSIHILNTEKVTDLGLYLTYKKDMQQLGKKLDILHVKKEKKQKEMVKNAWHELMLYDDVKPKSLFLANLYIYDDVEFCNQVKEALSFGVKPEHIVSYLNLQGYPITEAIYNLKLAEFAIYQKHFERTNNWYMIDEVLEKTGAAKVSIEALNEYKVEELKRKQAMEKEDKNVDYQKIISFPNYLASDERVV